MKHPSAVPNSTMLLDNSSGDGTYARYFALLDRSLDTLGAWASGWSRGALSAGKLVPYLRGLQACYCILRERFTFETNDSVLIDVMESGFPHSYMLSRVAADRAKAMDERSPDQLKRIFVNELFETCEINRALLNAIACARYAHMFDSMKNFDPRFHLLEPEPHENMPGRFRIYWACFDRVWNIPMLFGMEFLYDGKDIRSDTASLGRVLDFESSAGTSVALIAHRIDEAMNQVHPLFLSRVLLGPLHIPGISKDDAPWRGIMQEYGGTDSYVIELIADHTYATEELRTPTPLAVRLGVRPTPLRVYSINDREDLPLSRGASSVEKIVILPHRMVQVLRTNSLIDTSTYTLEPYGPKGELL